MFRYSYKRNKKTEYHVIFGAGTWDHGVNREKNRFKYSYHGKLNSHRDTYVEKEKQRHNLLKHQTVMAVETYQWRYEVIDEGV